MDDAMGKIILTFHDIRAINGADYRLGIFAEKTGWQWIISHGVLVIDSGSGLDELLASLCRIKKEVSDGRTT